jgi:hypothetical protein
MLRSRSWQAPLTLHIYSIDAINVVPCVAEFRVREVERRYAWPISLMLGPHCAPADKLRNLVLESRAANASALENGGNLGLSCRTRQWPNVDDHTVGVSFSALAEFHHY